MGLNLNKSSSQNREELKQIDLCIILECPNNGPKNDTLYSSFSLSLNLRIYLKLKITSVNNSFLWWGGYLKTKRNSKSKYDYSL